MATKDEIAKVFRDRMLEYQRERRVGNRMLAVLLGVPYDTLQYWMAARSTPCARHLVTISQNTGRSCDWWLGLED